MNQWKYVDSSNTVVFRYLENGGMESMLVASKEVQSWLAEDNEPLPADEPQVQSPENEG